MNQTNIVLGTLAALLLTACGGGGGNDAPPVVTPSKMAAYVGTWAGTCSGHELPYVTISETAGVKDTASYTGKSEYFSQTGCTGTVVATATYSANFSATVTSSVDGSIVLTTGAAAIAAKVDDVLLTAPAYTYTLTGSGVTHPVTDGQAEWCIAYGDGTSTCFRDTPVPASTPHSLYLYVSGGKMYDLFKGQFTYTVTEVWTKK